MYNKQGIKRRKADRLEKILMALLKYDVNFRVKAVDLRETPEVQYYLRLWNGTPHPEPSPAAISGFLGIRETVRCLKRDMEAYKYTYEYVKPEDSKYQEVIIRKLVVSEGLVEEL